MFGRFGAAAFAERARRELQATGETVRKRAAEYHLHKVFSKLGISSRRQLRHHLAQPELRTA